MTEQAKQAPEGLNGWLMLVGLALVVAPLRLLMTMPPMYTAMFSDGTWEALSTPGTPVYSWAWAPVIYTEMAMNAGFFLASLLLLYQFFARKKAFPWMYAAFLLGTLAFTLIEGGVIHLIAPDQPLIDPDSVADFVRSCVAALIWVPYMFISKRVKHTFVK